MLGKICFYLLVAVPVLFFSLSVVLGSVQRTGSGNFRRKYKREAFGSNPAGYFVIIFDLRTGEEVDYEVDSTLYFKNFKKIVENEQIKFKYRFGKITKLYAKDQIAKLQLMEVNA